MRQRNRPVRLAFTFMLPFLLLGSLYQYVTGLSPAGPSTFIPAGDRCQGEDNGRLQARLSEPWPSYLYNVTYGWFDTTHFNTGQPGQVIADVITAVLSGGDVITVSQGLHGGVTGYSGRYWVSGQVAKTDVLAVALGVYLDWSYRFEAWQGEPPRSLAAPFTSFAIEDLPSQYLGFFAVAHDLTLAEVFACYLGGADVLEGEPPHLAFGANLADPEQASGIQRLQNESFTPLVETEEGWQHRPWPETMRMVPLSGKLETWSFLSDETWYLAES
jgi:hypothetical protein